MTGPRAAARRGERRGQLGERRGQLGDGDAAGTGPRAAAACRGERRGQLGGGDAAGTGPRAVAACILAAALTACSQGPFGPTAADAEAFVDAAGARLLALRREASHAAWAQHDLATGDMRAQAALTAAALAAAEAELAREATRFDGLDLPEATARKLTRLKTAAPTSAPGLPASAPGQPSAQEELADVLADLERTHAAGAYCAGAGEHCLERAALEETVAELRDTDRLLGLWDEGRTLTPSMRPRFERLVEIANAGAAELGYADAGERWRSAHDLPPETFRAELERLWSEVRPLYESLHCLVRAELGAEYGTAIAPPGEAIPAHLLGDLGTGDWSTVYGMVAPRARGRGYDLTRELERSRMDPPEMARHAERFFGSLGFDPLPATFWERSRFVRPADREVDCRADGWNVDGGNDVRVAMCLEVDGDDFIAAHREIARAHYRWAYRSQDPLHRAGAGDVLLAAAGGAAALAVTPGRLVAAGLLEGPPPAAADVPLLLRQALDDVASLPFALLVDEWRWRIFAGEVGPDRYNQAWWELREEYQGIRAPAPRGAADFDPGVTRGVVVNEPRAQDFLAAILRFQIHRALCAAAGEAGPPHRCSLFGSRAAGARLRALFETGASRPWPETLAAAAGAGRADASALLEYFAPLAAWLDERNAGRPCGW